MATDIREGRDCGVFKKRGSFGQQVQLHKKEGFTVFLIKEGWCLATGSVTLERNGFCFFNTEAVLGDRYSYTRRKGLWCF